MDSWFNEAQGRDAKAVFHASDCALQIDDVFVDLDIPLRHASRSRKEARPHVYVFGLSSNSQLPGLYILDKASHKAQLPDATPDSLMQKTAPSAAWFVISPDLCSSLEVTLTRTDDQVAIQEKRRQWQNIELQADDANGSAMTKGGLLEIAICFKKDQNPLCRVRREDNDNGSLLTATEAMCTCSDLRLLAVIQGDKQLQAVEWFNTVLDQQKMSPWLNSKSFWSHHSQYAQKGYDIASPFAEALYQGFQNDDMYPDILLHLLDSATGKFSDISMSYSKPIVATTEQAVSLLMLGLLREMQFMTGHMKYVSTITHKTLIYHEEAEHGYHDFYFDVHLSPGVDERLFPAIGRKATFTCRLHDKDLSLNAYVIENRSSFQGTLLLFRRLPQLHKDGEELLASFRKSKNNTIESVVQISLHISHTGHEHQLKALLQLLNSKLLKDQFHLANFLIKQPGIMFTTNLEKEFEEKTESRTNSSITPDVRQSVDLETRRVCAAADPEQRDFMRAVLNRFDNGYLELTCPPGTGKTETLASCAYLAVLHDQKVVICAQTSNSVDRLFRAFLELLYQAKSNLGWLKLKPVRVYHTSAEEQLRSSRYAEVESNMNSASKQQDLIFPEYSLSELAYTAAMDASTTDPALLKYGTSLRQLKERGKLSELDRVCTPDQARNAEQAILSASQAIFVTSDSLCPQLQNGRITCDMLIIDESSLMTMGQFNQNLQNNPDCKRVITAGDSQQLNPKFTSSSRGASEYGSIGSSSPFKSLYLEPTQRFRLVNNYRNPPIIVEFLNIFGYSGIHSVRSHKETQDVVEKVSKASIDKNLFQGRIPVKDLASKPIVFIDSPGRPEEKTFHPNIGHWGMAYGSTGSKRKTVTMAPPSRTARYNPDGIKLCLELASDLIYKASVAPHRIKILSMFRKDRDELVDRVGLLSNDDQSVGTGLTEVGIYTVDSFQGGEADVIILHLVSGSKDAMIWVGNKERLNVAATRARQLLFIVGQYSEFKSLMQGNVMGMPKRPSENVKKLLTFVFEKGITVRDQSLKRRAYGDVDAEAQRQTQAQKGLELDY